MVNVINYDKEQERVRLKSNKLLRLRSVSAAMKVIKYYFLPQRSGSSPGFCWMGTGSSTGTEVRRKHKQKNSQAQVQSHAHSHAQVTLDLGPRTSNNLLPDKAAGGLAIRHNLLPYKLRKKAAGVIIYDHFFLAGCSYT
jgi:hypothetical protein